MDKSIIEMANDLAKEIIERREEVLEAFIAKYGYQPDEMIICEQPSKGKWWVEIRHKWISVKDKLPENNQQVLVYGKGHYATCTFMGEDYWQKYLFMNYDMRYNTLGVTHWMPLPAPPEK